MLTLLDKNIEAYAYEHTTPSGELFDDLREVTLAETDMPQMQVGRIEGQLLTLLTRLCRATFAVEIGTFTGYSSLHIAQGLRDGGKLITCDIDAHATSIARRFWSRSSAGERIELRLAPAVDTLATIGQSIDLAFIDADKENYITYWDLLVPKMTKGGLIIADNVLWSGKVLKPQEASDQAIVDFNAHVRADVRVEHVMLTVRDGIMLSRVK